MGGRGLDQKDHKKLRALHGSLDSFSQREALAIAGVVDRRLDLDAPGLRTGAGPPGAV